MKVRNGETLRLAASVKERSQDQWWTYRLSAARLASRILEWLEELEH